MKKIISNLLGVSLLSILHYTKGAMHRLLIHPRWQTVKNGILKGLELFIDDDYDSTFHDMIHGNYDEHILDIAEKCKLSGKVIWDIGAFIGHDTLGFARIVGDEGKVISFDPNPTNMKRLKLHLNKNKELKRRVILNQIALGSNIGTAYFNMSNNIESTESSGGYLDTAKPPLSESSYKSFSKHKVKVDTIDNLIKNHTLIPDLIHLDVEGAEAEVLIGAARLLNRYCPLLLIEVHHIRAMARLYDILYPLGYKIQLIDSVEESTSRAFILAQRSNIK